MQAKRKKPKFHQGFSSKKKGEKPPFGEILLVVLCKDLISNHLIMKKFTSKISKITYFFICSLIFSITFSCEDVKETANDNEKAKAEMLTHIIPLDDAFNMYDNYSKNRINIINDSLQVLFGNEFHDTRTVWFNIETLKEYIKYVEQTSAKNKVTPQGLKICFGVYDNDSNLGKKANHQNIFFVPTTEKNGRQAAYTIQEEKGVVYLKDARKNNTQQNSPHQEKAGFFTFSTFQASGLVLNRGTGVPPPQSGDNDFE